MTESDKKENPLEWFQTIGFFSEIRAQADSARENRNQFIEWTFGLTGGLLIASILGGSTTPWILWGGTALTLLMILPLMRLAVAQQAHMRQGNFITKHLIAIYGHTKPWNFEASPQHVTNVIKEVWYDGKVPESHASLYWNVAQMGFAYIGAASLTAFLAVSYYFIWVESSKLAPLDAHWVFVLSKGVLAILAVQVILIYYESGFEQLQVDLAFPECQVCRENMPKDHLILPP